MKIFRLTHRRSKAATLTAPRSSFFRYRNPTFQAAKRSCTATTRTFWIEQSAYSSSKLCKIIIGDIVCPPENIRTRMQ